MTVASFPRPSPLGPRTSRGFTLIEVMVVIVLIGITVSIVTLSVGSSAGRQAEQEARRLAALVDLASEEAVLKSTELAILFRQDGYQFYALGSDNAWRPAEDDVLRLRSLPEGFTLAVYEEGLPLKLEQTTEQPTPHAFFLSSGERTAFEVEVGPEAGPRYRVSVPVIGDLAVLSPDEMAARP